MTTAAKPAPATGPICLRWYGAHGRVLYLVPVPVFLHRYLPGVHTGRRPGPPANAPGRLCAPPGISQLRGAGDRGAVFQPEKAGGMVLRTAGRQIGRRGDHRRFPGFRGPGTGLPGSRRPLFSNHARAGRFHQPCRRLGRRRGRRGGAHRSGHRPGRLAKTRPFCCARGFPDGSGSFWPRRRPKR